MKAPPQQVTECSSTLLSSPVPFPVSTPNLQKEPTIDWIVTPKIPMFKP